MGALPLVSVNTGFSADVSARFAPGIACSPVEFSPSDIARHDITRWNGIKMDAVEIVRREPYEYGAMSACHLLIMAERGERDDGETLVEGLPRSTLRDFSGRLSFVPSGHRFHGWQKPRVLTRVTYFIIDPRGPLLDPELNFAATEFKPRLYFRDPELWSIAAKLKEQGGTNAGAGQRQYAESLSILLAHELLRLNNGAATERSDAGHVRGGLAGWQRNRVADYVEEHLAENVPLATLAELARLSPFHFSRAFKQSFGTPPHRYLIGRRIERAKEMLAGAEKSVTEIGLALGFAETSSFTSAFRKRTGVTPTVYRRSLD
jgi:AraC family transcriptional regulator